MDIIHAIVITATIIMTVITFIFLSNKQEARLSQHWGWNALAIMWVVSAAVTVGGMLYRVWI